MIHSTAIVSEKAKIGNNVEIGPFTIIEDKVIIEDNCKIGAHVTIADGT
ncbi:MAG: acyl-[acyl-carrier-protein]--UDP-N-acetylglucosamine O-acyltransferase, partial [Candidatus Delongbacteria bacterium]|nr:acyl-[acyl-carrier-protein]--UDP-N-acetylglucosamine O-acyltransferase [Candidatus Delongbacteria bacterium]